MHEIHLSFVCFQENHRSENVSGCLYTRLLSKTKKAAKFYLTKNGCVKAQVKSHCNFTLHLIEAVKLKRFKKVSSDLKTILMTDLTDLRFLEL